MKRITILIIILFVAGRLWALSWSAVVPDFVDSDSVQPDSLAKTEDIILRSYIEKDTSFPKLYPLTLRQKIPLVYLPDSLIKDSLRYEYTKIKDFAYRAKWTKELYKLVFVNPRPGRVNVMRVENSEQRFRRYAGKRIHDISIKVLPPYGTSVYDTTYFEEDMGWLKTLANKTHMRTAEGVIRKQLTIKPGMVLRPFELVQNEILLRHLDYIDDANFLISEVASDTNSVHIVLICKDQLSWGASIESNFLNSFELGLENKNFLKLGHVLNYEFSYRGTKEKKWGNILEYRVNSIWGSHIDVRGYYQNDYREKKVFASIDREFLTSRMKWAGGVSAGRVYYSNDLPDRDITRLEELFDYHYQDVWLGKSFLLPVRYSYNQNIYLTTRFFTTLFNHRPVVTNDTNHLYYNRWDYFGAFTYTKIKYYKANLIYDFGRTEDIPTGLFFSAIHGFEKSEFANYGYLGFEGRYSHFNNVTERLYGVEAALGSYISKDGFERGIFSIGGRYISHLCNWGSLRFRFYNDVHYIRGIRRFPGDYLYIEDADIRGFFFGHFTGKPEVSPFFGYHFFLPYVKKGFRTSFSSFVDWSIIADEDKAIARSKSYWGIGVALNLRNDNVVIKNLTFRFTFYPTVPEDGKSVQVMLSGRRRGGFYDYRVTKPQVIQYE